MNHLVSQRQLSQDIICDSAGTGGYHIGSSPDRRMAAAAQQKLGVTLRGQARQFQRADFEKFDLILAMDRENYQDILQLDPHGKYDHKVKLMCEFCRRHPDEEVPDPYYGGAEGFNYVIDLLTDACEGLLVEIAETYSTK
jgi:protein-tyrosine phosphatase